MDKWERLRIMVQERQRSAATARDMIDDMAKKRWKQAVDAFNDLNGKAIAFADVLRMMEEIEGDNNGNY